MVTSESFIAVYMMADRYRGTLYVGVTSDLASRITQHREGKGGTFTAKYKCIRLVYIEHYPTIEDATAREKAIEAWQKAAPLAKDGEVYLNLATALWQEDRIPEAKQAAKSALEKGVKKPETAKKIIALP